MSGFDRDQPTGACPFKAQADQSIEQGRPPHPLLGRSLYFGKGIPIADTAYQAGTGRFGTDPATSVPDLDCRAHEVNNFHLADASFFPSIDAINPPLTIIANPLWVAGKSGERL